MMQMNIDDITSFFLAIVAVIYVIGGLVRAAKSQRLPKPRQKHEQEHESPTPPPAPPLARSVPVKEPYDFHTSIEDRHLNVSLKTGDELVSESLRLFQTEGTLIKKSKKPPIQQQIKSLPTEKLLLISYEVFSVPVSRRRSLFPWNG